jgi:hypothetical protein
MSWGVNYAKNWVEMFVNKAKVTPIPNLGVSYTEVRAALEAKNIIGAFGLIKKGINTVSQYYDNGPSSKLSNPIQTNAILMDFINELSKSRATDDNESQILIEAANVVLNNRGLWEKIRDYSYATNDAGPMEINTQKRIETSNAYQLSIPKVETKITKIESAQIISAVPSSHLGGNIPSIK